MNVQKYRTNLNCNSCVAAVKPYLDGNPEIRRWAVDTADPNKILTIESEEVSAELIERHISDAGFRVYGRVYSAPAAGDSAIEPFIVTYWPLILVFAYLIGIVGLIEFAAGRFDWMRGMANFMGGFFVVFSFFKLLDLNGFVDSFQTYDIVAARSRAYGYSYPPLELAIGIAYLIRFAPPVTNLVTLVVMGVGAFGVINALRQKRVIRCACLGTVFNLPMSKVTLVEDTLMAGMALVSLGVSIVES